MDTLIAAIALLLVIEGGVYAIFPGGMKRMLAEVLAMSEQTLRNAGMIAAAIGFGILWFLFR